MGLIGIIFIFLMCVVPSMQMTATYSIECEENGDITVIGLSSKSTVQLVTVNGQTNVSIGCLEKKPEVEGKVIIPAICAANVKNDRTFVIKVFDPFFDPQPTTKAPTSTPASSTTAAATAVTQTPAQAVTQTHAPEAPSETGSIRKQSDLSHFEHLKSFTCRALKEEGVVEHIIQQLRVQDTGPLPTKYIVVGNVEMRFKPEARQTNDQLLEIPDISSVYLGDRFYMYLKYTGIQGYMISPQNCTAYDGDWPVLNYEVPNVILWTYEMCVSEDSKRYHLMHNFNKVDDKTVYAEMYGFHFGENKDITIACDVRICPKDDANLKCHVQDANEVRTCTDGWTRRKRSIESGTNVQVMRKLQIKDSKPTGNAAGMLRNSWLLVFFVQFFCT